MWLQKTVFLFWSARERLADSVELIILDGFPVESPVLDQILMFCE